MPTARTILLIASSSFAVACGSDTTTNTNNNSSGLPSGKAACSAKVLAKQSQECTVGANDCGLLNCVITGGAFANRCNTIECVQDVDCKTAYTSLCTNVEWVCEAHITSNDRRCNVREVNTAPTGIALCDKIKTTPGCGSEHVDRCVQGWPKQKTDHPMCVSQIDAVMACFNNQTVTCRRDADVSIGFGTDPDNPVYYTQGLYSISEFGVSWYPGTACGTAATAWNDCIYH